MARPPSFSHIPTFCRNYYLVGAVGLEPTRPCGLRILSPVRLPIPPRPRGLGREYNS